jgi:hypothetical protein
MKRESLGIAIVAICMSIAFMPADASDFTIEIFGNANMDDTLDEADIEYVQGIIDGPTMRQNWETNYDGVIDEEDISQIEIIMDILKLPSNASASRPREPTHVSYPLPISPLQICSPDPPPLKLLLNSSTESISSDLDNPSSSAYKALLWKSPHNLRPVKSAVGRADQVQII